jgi:hypothetical protein
MEGMAHNIRTERTIEVFSRGLELVRAIERMWALNAKETWRGNNVVGWVPPSVAIVERIKAVMAEFDLTLPEFHYWCRQIEG